MIAGPVIYVNSPTRLLSNTPNQAHTLRMACIQFDLTDDEEARFSMLLREMQLFNPYQEWTPSSLAKSLVLGVIDDDLEAHSLPDDEGEAVVVH